MELSTYFRINNESGQFERTLIIAEEGASVSYLEVYCAHVWWEPTSCCSGKLVAMDHADIKYSTMQIGTLGMKMVRVVFIILLLKEVFVRETTVKFLGLS